MQTSLTFTQHTTLPDILDRLEYSFGQANRHRRDALRQLIYMVIAEGAAPSVGLAVFDRLQAVYPTWVRLSDADVHDLEALFIGLSNRQKKAAAILEILHAIEAERGDLDLDHLSKLPTEAARAWLETLPGVTGVMASAVLSFSTLERPSLPIDRENVRPFRRLGLCLPGAPLSAVGRQVMEGAPAEWSGAQMASLAHGLGRLATTVCTRGKPACKRCPLMTLCPSNNHSAEVVAFPGRQAREDWRANRTA